MSKDNFFNDLTRIDTMNLKYNPSNMVDDVMRYIVDHIRNTVYAHHDHHKSRYGPHGTYHPTPFAYTIDSREIESAIHAVVSNPEKLARLILEDHNLKAIMEMAEGERRREDKMLQQTKKRNNDSHNNGIEHEKYEEALDILDEFAELGIDDLDEEQQELYDEALDIVKTYEKT